MFNSFKFGGPDRSGGDYNEKSSVQHSHTVSTELSDDDKSEFDVKEGPSSSTAGEPVDRATGLPPGSPRRTFASVMSDIFRRSSETSNKDGSDPPSRKHSQQTEPSRARGVATALGLFQSHNPDVDSEEAAAVNSPFPRKGSVVSNHSGEDIPSPIPEMTRRPSYMPRNATASFLKTANGTSEVKPEEKEKMEAEKAAAGRKPSVMGSVMGVGSGGDAAGTTPTTRRPSGMVPNNVAARYVRSAGSGHPEEDRPDLNSRRRSSTRKSVSDAQIRAVPMQADQFQQWQNSVQRNGSRVSFAPPIVRQRSVDDVAEDVEGEEQELIAQSNKHQNGRAKIVTISVQPATPERNTKERQSQPMRQTKPMSAFLPEDMGPVPSNFGAEIDHDLSQITETDSRPETPLESLGFKGAVPA